jgi:hypothetical protein
VTVKLKGVDDLIRGARRLTDNVEDGARDVGRIVADQLAASARSSVPRLTGRLAGSVTSRVSPGAGTAMAGMGEGLIYAGWIEYGGSRGRPHVRARQRCPTSSGAWTGCSNRK